ncbi:response regulator [Planctomycetota bacterium]
MNTIRVLMIDDDEDEFVIVRDCLLEVDGTSYDIEWISSYQPALEAIRRGKMDVCLVDYRLGSKDGLQLIHEAVAGECPAPCILLTGQGDKEIDVAAMASGASDYLVKDQVDASILERSIRHAMERKRAEEELQTTNAKLAEAIETIKRAQEQIIQQERLRALGEMASGIAHDFNNALAPILGFSELLLRRPANMENVEKVKHHLDLIHKSAKDAANVVSRLREFYSPSRASDEYKAVDVNRIIEDAVSLARPKWKDLAQAGGAPIDLITELATVPPVKGNDSELRETIANLIFNAVDAMPEGGTMTIRSGLKDSNVFIDIEDTGVGMSEEVRARCLEPFFSTKGTAGGTGLGLATAYGVVTRHEGAITITSEQGKGTTFRITFPTMRMETKPPADTDCVKARPLHVLVVDDEGPIRDFIGECLVEMRHTVQTACDGEEGLRAFSDGVFDLVILDRAMPKMNGDQLAAAIKECSPDMPILMVTGFGEMMSAFGDTPKHVDQVVPKPLTILKLEKAVGGLTGGIG